MRIILAPSSLCVSKEMMALLTWPANLVKSENAVDPWEGLGPDLALRMKQSEKKLVLNAKVGLSYLIP